MIKKTYHKDRQLGTLLNKTCCMTGRRVIRGGRRSGLRVDEIPVIYINNVTDKIWRVKKAKKWVPYKW